MSDIESKVSEDVRGFESSLVDALQPVRHYFVAQIIHYVLKSGMYDELKTGIRLPFSGATASRRDAILQFLSNEGYVEVRDEDATLTAKGRDIGRFAPWYELLIGGYGRTLDSLDAILNDDQSYATREDASVGAGSCGMSHFDAVPIFRALIADQRVSPDAIVDLGCGDGGVLIELSDLARQVVGVDPAPANIEAAQANAASADLRHRSTFVVGTAETWWGGALSRDKTGAGRVDYIMGFALQEVVEQSGRQAAVDLVRKATEQPGSALLIVEVEPQLTPGMKHPLDLAYYNAYYLMHKMTRQRLEPRSFWLEVVEEAGAYVAASALPPREVDSTGHEFGMRIERKV
jgi:2-ketoarginine methyltransferase